MHNAQLVTLPIGQHTMHSNSCAGKLQNEIIFCCSQSHSFTLKPWLRDGPLENLWWGRAKYKKKYSRKAKLNEKKFMHAT